MSNQVVVVSGVSGQDGSHMVDYLLKNTDYDIIGTVRRLSVPNHKNIDHIKQSERFKTVYFDLTDNESIQDIIQKYKPKYFINLAAQSFVGSSWDIPVVTWNTNATGVLHILEAIRKFSPETRFYNAGTSEEFGDVDYSPQDELHPLRPRSPYGASKAAARHLVKTYRDSYGIYAVQGWLMNHEGTRRGPEFLTRKVSMGVANIDFAISQKEDFEPIYLGNLEAKRDWSDAEDFVDAIWRMLNQDIYKEGWESYKDISEYVVASGETHSVKEFVECAFNASFVSGEWEEENDPEKIRYVEKETGKPLVKISPEFYRPAEVSLLLGTSEKIKKELGWVPKSQFEDLVRKMVLNDMRLIRIKNRE